MGRKWLYGSVIAGLFAFTVTANAAVIFSTLGPGDTYNSSAGGLISGAGTVYGVNTQANQFTSTSNVSLGQIDLGLSWLSGANVAAVSLWSASGSIPGAQLGSWSVSGLPTFGSSSNQLTTISGITGIDLVGGLNYFLRVDAAAGSVLAWNWNSIGAMGTIAVIESRLSSDWRSVTGTLYAFALHSASVPVPVPEPSSVALLLLGLVALFAFGPAKVRSFR